MHLTPGIFDAHLDRHDPEKPVCFSRSITGLSFYRYKIRGERLLQIEFSESIYRDRDGRLIIDLVFPIPENPKEDAPTVRSLMSTLRNPELKNFHLFFGGSEDALTFEGTEDFGEWVSINFKQKVYRDEHGGLTVEEIRNGIDVREEFPVSELREIRPGDFPGLENLRGSE